MNMVPSASAEEGFWTSRRFLLVLTVLLLCIFPKVILGQTTFFFRDAGALGYPMGIFFQGCLLHGELPLWNAYSHCGVPFLAQMGTWYPGNWLFLLLPSPWSLNLCLLLHLVLGGWGIYTLARRWGVDGFAASFAGFAYLFNGVTLSCFQWGNYIESLGWLPWVVITVTEAWRRGGRWIPLAAIISALQVLTATPEVTLLSWLFLAVLWLSEWISGGIKFSPSSSRVILLVLLAAGITMVQMLPFFDLLSHSQRNSGNTPSYWNMPGWGWANLIVPLFHCYLSPQGNWFQHDQDFLMSYYPGLGVLALAVFGVWLKPNRTILIVAVTILGCWILALGNAGYIYPLAKKIFPWLGVARFPVKFTILSAFLLPILGAWAIHNFQSSTDRRSRYGLWASGGIFILLAVILVIFARKYPFPGDATNAMTWNAVIRIILMLTMFVALFWQAKANIPCLRLVLQWFALAFLLGDLLSHSLGITPTLPSSVMAPGLWQADGRPSIPLGTGRIMSSPEAERKLLFSRVSNNRTDFLGKRLAEWYNLNLIDLVPKVDGAITLRPAYFDLVEQRIYHTRGSTYGKGLPDFLSVAWESDPNNPVKWIPHTNSLPIISCGQRPEFKNDAEALDAMTDKNFDPRKVVFLPESDRKVISVSNQTTCIIKQSRFQQNQVKAEVQATTTSIIVLSRTFYHLWQASVDGQRVPLLRANVAFQALQVPPGMHQIKLVYRDPNLLIGAVISITSLFICLVIWRKCPAMEKLDLKRQPIKL